MSILTKNFADKQEEEEEKKKKEKKLRERDGVHWEEADSAPGSNTNLHI